MSWTWADIVRDVAETVLREDHGFVPERDSDEYKRMMAEVWDTVHEGANAPTIPHPL